jgi:HEPN domain
MDREGIAKVIDLFDSRGQLDRISSADSSAAVVCLERAVDRLRAAEVLAAAEIWESAFTVDYDAYRTAADAVVLWLGYRVPATQGGHRIAADIANAALRNESDAYASAVTERFRQGRHGSEYFDPARSIDKTEDDAAWAIALTSRAIAAVRSALAE